MINSSTWNKASICNIPVCFSPVLQLGPSINTLGRQYCWQWGEATKEMQQQLLICTLLHHDDIIRQRSKFSSELHFSASCCQTAFAEVKQRHQHGFDTFSSFHGCMLMRCIDKHTQIMFLNLFVIGRLRCFKLFRRTREDRQENIDHFTPQKQMSAQKNHFWMMMKS